MSYIVFKDFSIPWKTLMDYNSIHDNVKKYCYHSPFLKTYKKQVLTTIRIIIHKDLSARDPGRS